jgi:DNA processing protein
LTKPGDGPQFRDWLALLRAPGVGPRKFRRLVEWFGSPAAVLSQSRNSLLAFGQSDASADWLAAPDWQSVERDLEWLRTPGNRCLTFQDREYPRLLHEITDPPPVLFLRGEAGVLNQRQLAVVGSRNPSTEGSKLARDFSANLVHCGFAITSGLALGIDAASHRGALDAGGFTVAVAGTGLDQVYPARHRDLAEEIIAKGGALISEFPTGTPPQPANFPKRNRIISGLSLGTLVVEAALRSGSLITARMALEQGREVFALPGSIHNPLSRGCNALIKEGAKLVETVQDILDEFPPGTRAPPPDAVPAGVTESEWSLDPECRALLKCIAYAPTSVDTLIAAMGSSPEAIASSLLLLELQGYITSTSGGYSRIK